MTRMIAFGDIVKEKNRLVDVIDSKEYACGGVRLHGRGVFIREYKLGSEIKKKFVQHVVHNGDIVYSTLFAKSGAFALADEKVDGIILSEKFPTFTLESDLVNRDYLKWLFRSGQLNRIAEDQMTGMAAFSLAHLSKKKFLQLKIPVPSLDRQAEVVRLCEIANTEATKCLSPIQQNLVMLDGLIGAAAAKAFVSLTRAKMSDIGDYVLRNVEIEAGTKYLQITVAMKHRGLRLRRICDGSEIKSPGQSSVMEDDILFSRIDIRQGAIGFVNKELEGGVVTRDFPIFRLHSLSEADRAYMKYVFMSPEFMSQAKDASRGTTGRKKMKRPAFLEIRVPWPPSPNRASISRHLIEVERHVSVLVRNYRKQEILAKGIRNAIVETLFAKDAGII